MTSSEEEKETSLIGDYPEEYIKGIELFNQGEYFEAHETWESLWLVSTGAEKRFLQGLIQSAVALYHYELQRFGAARKTFERAREKLLGLPQQYMSLDIPTFLNQMERFFRYEPGEAPLKPHGSSPRPTLPVAKA